MERKTYETPQSEVYDITPSSEMLIGVGSKIKEGEEVEGEAKETEWEDW